MSDATSGERKSAFVYVIYIRSTAEKVWEALTTREFQRQYWFGMHQETDWKPGSSWRLVFEDGDAADAGEILEFDPPKRLVIKWRNEFRPQLKEEGFAHCEITLEPQGDLVKLTVMHSIGREKSKLIEAVSGGWPRILSSLKSLLETGEAHAGTHKLPED